MWKSKLHFCTFGNIRNWKMPFWQSSWKKLKELIGMPIQLGWLHAVCPLPVSCHVFRVLDCCRNHQSGEKWFSLFLELIYDDAIESNTHILWLKTKKLVLVICVRLASLSFFLPPIDNIKKLANHQVYLGINFKEKVMLTALSVTYSSISFLWHPFFTRFLKTVC